MTEEEKTEIAEVAVAETPVVEETTDVGEVVPANEEPAVEETASATADESVPGAAAEESVPHLEPLKLDGAKPKGPHVPLPSSLQEIVGALLFASESPLSASELRTCIRGVMPEEGEDAEVMSVYRTCTSREIEQALHGLEKELERSGCGFRLVCTGGTYRLQTVPACGRYVRALLKLDRPNRLSRAALETLAIIAYRQPITKAEIEQIRGVAVDTIVKSLVELQLVRLVGRSELPGHPFLYGTSPAFLEHFGLSSLSELNEIDPTLQRSNPRERAKMFIKEKKAEEKPAEENQAEEKGGEEKPAEAAAVAETTPAAEAAETSTAADVPASDDGDAPEERSARVSFRPNDDEEFDDDEPLAEDDDSDDDDDEPLADDDSDDDDEPLTDDDDDSDDDDEPLTDDDDDSDDDDEPLTDDDDDDSDDDDDDFDDDDDDDEEEEDEDE